MSDIQRSIRNLTGSPGTDLVSVPTEDLDQQMAIRVLQIQIFTLADEIAQLRKELGLGT